MAANNNNVDVFVGNDTLIDPDIYQLWLNGHTVLEAALIQQKRGNLQHYSASFEMLQSDIDDHFRTLRMLERYLKNPSKLANQLELQIPPVMQNILIEKYYEFDSVIVREFLGKKLTSRHRNSLDDISEKTRISLKSCRRQFDNVKRVFKTVEEMFGSLVDNIVSSYLLSRPLAQQYAAIVFITNNRFDLSRKKLSYLTFGDFVHCANMMMTYWSFNTKDGKDHENSDVDLDRDFLQEVREMKILLEKEYLDEHRQLMTKAVHKRLTSDAASDLDSNFKYGFRSNNEFLNDVDLVLINPAVKKYQLANIGIEYSFPRSDVSYNLPEEENIISSISKTLISIGHGLNHSKDLKDIFLDLLEKFIEPCRTANWTKDDVRVFFNAYQQTGCLLSLFTRNNQHQQLLLIWDHYMKTVSSCVFQMYHT